MMRVDEPRKQGAALQVDDPGRAARQSGDIGGRSDREIFPPPIASASTCAAGRHRIDRAVPKIVSAPSAALAGRLAVRLAAAPADTA